MLKNIILIFISIFLCITQVYALELDMSVDEEIKKKYNSSKLEYDVLPQLPKVDNSGYQSPPKTQLEYSSNTPAPAIVKIQPGTGEKITSGTKFSVRSNTAISDWQARGTNVSFTTTSPVYKKNITIPSGTVFRGTIINSHQPQVTGNGGLVVIKLNSMTYNSKSYEVNAKITKANTKKIFLNNMKGERKYWKGVSTRINQGENFYSKAKQKSNKLAGNPVFMILSPIPTVVGIVGCTVCTVLSPVTALTTKGGHLSIPAGSQFEIKLLDSAYVY